MALPLVVLAADDDGDGLDDAWEQELLGAVGLYVGSDDPDLDGLTNLEEQAAGTDPLDVDSDGDHLLDGEEVAVGTDPLLEDSDGDGLSDHAELFIWDTDPLSADSDGGGTDDGAEVGEYGTDPLDAMDDPQDSDGDGITDQRERLLGTHPDMLDSDGDGLDDGVEDANQDGVWSGDLNGNLLWEPGLGEETSPILEDSDGDGLSDGLEVLIYGTDPYDADSDDDGLGDGEEHDLRMMMSTCLDPRLPDSDYDGLLDGDERLLGTDPCMVDSDGDGLFDLVELWSGTGPLDPDAYTLDSDGDGLSDEYEQQVLLSDPDALDSDDDGLDDGEEALPLGDHYQTDPTDADSDDDGVLDGNEGGVETDGAPVGGSSPVDWDTDGDGLSDGLELGLAVPQREEATLSWLFQADLDPASVTDPLTRDTDGDGLSDGLEDANHDGRVAADEMDPRDPDSDGDGMDDGWEWTYSTAEACAPGVSPLDPLDPLDETQDLDDDGLSCLEEYLAVGTASVGDDGRPNPCHPDSDGDGLLDGIEWYSDYDGESSDPLDPDSDGDGLADGLEDANHDGYLQADDETGPTTADSDGDGLLDGEEDADQDGWLDVDETDPLDPDSDGDGLSDQEELRVLGTDPLSPDTDGDGLPDGLEVGEGGDADPASQTDPLLWDTDGDGLSDGQEDADGDGAWGAGETHPRAADTDGDGLTDGQEDTNLDAVWQAELGETDPRVWDTDGGGVDDGTEVTEDGTDPLDPDDDYSADPDGDDLDNERELALGTDPHDADSDDDGLSDGLEVGVDGDLDPDTTTDPLDADSDDDGLPDGIEDFDHDGWDDGNESDPLDPDSDGDGLLDGEEDVNGNGAWDAAAGESSALDWDSDDGGVGDGEEVLRDGTNPMDYRDDLTGDPDSDGLINQRELELGTDPLDADSDGDLIGDGVEVGAGDVLDTDGDGVIDALDVDSDGDSLTDLFEAGDMDLATAPRDTDGDGLPDYRDLDSDNGGVDDKVEVTQHGTDPLDPTDDGRGWLEDGAHISGGCGCAGGGSRVPSSLWGLFLLLGALSRRRRARPLVAAAVATLATLGIGDVQAQQTHEDALNASVDANPYRPDPAGSLLSSGVAGTLPPLASNLSAHTQIVSRPVRVVGADGEPLRSLVADREQLDLAGAIGLFGWLEAGFHLPVVVHQTAEYPGQKLGATPSTGLGNLAVQGRVSLLTQDGDSVLPVPDAPLSLAFTTPLYLPTATDDAWMGFDGWGAEPSLVAARRWGAVTVSGAFGALMQPRTSLFTAVDDDKLRWELGALWQPQDQPWQVALEYLGAARAAAPFANPDETTGELVLAGAWALDHGLRVEGGLGGGVVPGMAASGFRAYVGVSWHVGHPASAPQVVALQEARPAAVPPVAQAPTWSRDFSEDPSLWLSEPQSAPVVDEPALAVEQGSALPPNVLARLPFQQDDELEPGAQGSWSDLVDLLLLQGGPVRVAGYASQREAFEDNLRLSLRRAQVVRDMLSSLAPELAPMLQVVGLGPGEGEWVDIVGVQPRDDRVASATTP